MSRSPRLAPIPCKARHRALQQPRRAPSSLGAGVNKHHRRSSRLLTQVHKTSQRCCTDGATDGVYVGYDSCSRSRILTNPRRACSTPSVKPAVVAKPSASLYLFIASAKSLRISANSPRLCVAVAQPMSHSSVLSAGPIDCARACAFCAHRIAWATKSVSFGAVAAAVNVCLFEDGETVLWLPDLGLDGCCWAIAVARLFIRITAWHEVGGHSVNACKKSGVAR